MRAIMIVGVLLVLTPWARPVEAQSDDERARAHFLAGRSYFEQGRYEDSVREFELGYELSGRPIFLLNVATSLERLDRFGEAADKLEAYLSEEPEADDRRTLEARARTLRERAAEQAEQDQAGRVEEIEPTPTPTPDSPPQADVSAEEGRLGTMGAVGIIVASVGAASLLTSLATGLSAHARYQDLEDGCDERGLCPAALEDERDTGAALAKASTATLFVGLAALAAGTVLFTLDLSGGEERELSIGTGPGLAGLSVSGSF